MKIYIKYGFKDFIIPVGYKGNIIKNYFKKNSKNLKIVTLKLLVQVLIL